MDERSVAHLERLPDHAELDREYLKALRALEAERGRPMLPSELERFTREFHAPHYRAELRRIADLGAADDEDL